MPKHTEAAPSLPPASIDFNALDAACRAGKTPEEALAAALIGETVLDLGAAETVPETQEPEAAPVEDAKPTAADF